MVSYLLRRLLALVPVLLMISFLVFGFVRALPGDPARLLAGEEASAEDIALVRKDLGLDQPLLKQYVSFVWQALHGNFGLSLKTRRPVMVEIGERFLPTLTLTALSMLWAVLLGLVLGIGAAIYRNRFFDRCAMVLAVLGISFPSFWFGLSLIDLFAVKLNWLTTGGMEDGLLSFVLPSITLGVTVSAVTARFSRSSFVEAMRENYIRSARAKGVPELKIILNHALRNALIPVVTMIGLQFGFLLGGSIVIETVFSWPGMGRLLIDSVSYRDYPVIQAEILIFSLQFLLINLMVDVLYALINPKIRYQ